MKISRPRSKPPLSDAITLLEHAVDVAELYVQDREYIPTEREVQEVQELAVTLLLYSKFTVEMTDTLRQRMKSARPDS